MGFIVKSIRFILFDIKLIKYKMLHFLFYNVKNEYYKIKIKKILNEKKFYNEFKNNVLYLRSNKKYLLFDITDVIDGVKISGISRVLLNVLDVLFKKNIKNYEILPVYLTKYGYRVANEFVDSRYHKYNGRDVFFVFKKGDIFISLSHILSAINYTNIFDVMKEKGVQIFFFLYDLLPIQFPDYFQKEIKSKFINYIYFISNYSGIIADSKTTADLYREWRIQNIKSDNDKFNLQWTHLGFELKSTSDDYILSKNEKIMLEKMDKIPSVLMVSTIEPRKGYRQTLKAFEQLWETGESINLIIVGRQGWLMDDFIQILNMHPQNGHHLFWLNYIDDGYLIKLYQHCIGVLMASEGEGFGLSIIESAAYGKPLLLRNLPIFYEIAGEYAIYFEDDSPIPFALAIKQWIDIIQKESAPDSSNIKALTWEECAENILHFILPKTI